MIEQNTSLLYRSTQPDIKKQYTQFMERANLFFVGFERNEMAKKQFFTNLGSPTHNVRQIPYLFYGTNEFHRISRSTSLERKKDTIFWAPHITTALSFINVRVLDYVEQLTDGMLYSSLVFNRELRQPVLCIAKTKDILRDIRRGTREEIKAALAEEVIQTTGELREDQLFIIRTSSELELLEHHLAQKDPRLKKYLYSNFILPWRIHENRIAEVEEEIRVQLSKE